MWIALWSGRWLFVEHGAETLLLAWNRTHRYLDCNCNNFFFSSDTILKLKKFLPLFLWWLLAFSNKPITFFPFAKKIKLDNELHIPGTSFINTAEVWEWKWIYSVLRLLKRFALERKRIHYRLLHEAILISTRCQDAPIVWITKNAIHMLWEKLSHFISFPISTVKLIFMHFPYTSASFFQKQTFLLNICPSKHCMYYCNCSHVLSFSYI